MESSEYLKGAAKAATYNMLLQVIGIQISCHSTFIDILSIIVHRLEMTKKTTDNLNCSL